MLGFFIAGCTAPPTPKSTKSDTDYAAEVPRKFDEAFRGRLCEFLTEAMVREVVGEAPADLARDPKAIQCRYSSASSHGYEAEFSIVSIAPDADKASNFFYEITLPGPSHEALTGLGDEAALRLDHSDTVFVRYGNAIFSIQAAREHIARSPTPDDNPITWKAERDRAIAERRGRVIALAFALQEQLATANP